MSRVRKYLICLLFSSSVLASVSIDPGDVDFGELSSGDSSSETIYIENELNGKIKIEDISFFGDSSFFVSNYCPGFLAAYQECEIEVEFECDSLGEYEGSIDLEFEDYGHETIFVYGECI